MTGAAQPFIIFENNTKSQDAFWVHMANPGCKYDNGGGNTNPEARYHTTGRPDKLNYTSKRNRPCTFLDNDTQYRIVNSRDDLTSSDIEYLAVNSSRIPADRIDSNGNKIVGLQHGEILQIKIPMDEVLTVKRTPTECTLLFTKDPSTDEYPPVIVNSAGLVSLDQKKWYDVEWLDRPGAGTYKIIGIKDKVEIVDPNTNGNSYKFYVSWKDGDTWKSIITLGPEEEGKRCIYKADKGIWEHPTFWHYNWLKKDPAGANDPTNAYNIKNNSNEEVPGNPIAEFNEEREQRPVFCWDEYVPYFWPGETISDPEVQAQKSQSTCDPRSNGAGNNFSIVPVGGKSTITEIYHRNKDGNVININDNTIVTDLPDTKEEGTYYTMPSNPDTLTHFEINFDTSGRLGLGGVWFDVSHVDGTNTVVESYYLHQGGLKLSSADLKNEISVARDNEDGNSEQIEGYMNQGPYLELDYCPVCDHETSFRDTAGDRYNSEVITKEQLNEGSVGGCRIPDTTSDSLTCASPKTWMTIRKDNFNENAKAFVKPETIVWIYMDKLCCMGDEFFDEQKTNKKPKPEGCDNTISEEIKISIENNNPYGYEINDLITKITPEYSGDYYDYCGQYKIETISQDLSKIELNRVGSNKTLNLKQDKTWSHSQAWVYEYCQRDSDTDVSLQIRISNSKPLDDSGELLSDICQNINTDASAASSYIGKYSFAGGVFTQSSTVSKFVMDNPATYTRWNNEQEAAFAALIDETTSRGVENRMWWVTDRRAKNWCNWIQNFSENTDAYCWAANEKVYKMDPSTGQKLTKDGKIQMDETKALKFSKKIDTNLNINIKEILTQDPSSHEIKGCSTYLNPNGVSPAPSTEAVNDLKNQSSCSMWNSSANYACVPLESCKKKDASGNPTSEKCNWDCTQSEDKYCGIEKTLCRWDMDNLIPNCTTLNRGEASKYQGDVDLEEGTLTCFTSENKFRKKDEDASTEKITECGDGEQICKWDFGRLIIPNCVDILNGGEKALIDMKGDNSPKNGATVCASLNEGDSWGIIGENGLCGETQKKCIWNKEDVQAKENEKIFQIPINIEWVSLATYNDSKKFITKIIAKADEINYDNGGDSKIVFFDIIHTIDPATKSATANVNISSVKLSEYARRNGGTLTISLYEYLYINNEASQMQTGLKVHFDSDPTNWSTTIPTEISSSSTSLANDIFISYKNEPLTTKNMKFEKVPDIIAPNCTSFLTGDKGKDWSGTLGLGNNGPNPKYACYNSTKDKWATIPGTISCSDVPPESKTDTSKYDICLWDFTKTNLPYCENVKSYDGPPGGRSTNTKNKCIASQEQTSNYACYTTDNSDSTAIWACKVDSNAACGGGRNICRYKENHSEPAGGSGTATGGSGAETGGSGTPPPNCTSFLNKKNGKDWSGELSLYNMGAGKKTGFACYNETAGKWAILPGSEKCSDVGKDYDKCNWNFTETNLPYCDEIKSYVNKNQNQCPTSPGRYACYSTPSSKENLWSCNLDGTNPCGGGRNLCRYRS